MSTRWYPLYTKGNPQLRVFLPNFWMKLVKPKENMPKNIVTFHVSIQMTKYDIKNYLEKIYKVPVMRVNTRIALGEIKRKAPNQYVTKEDDIKYAYVYLPKDQEFVFPSLFETEDSKKEKDIEDRNMKDMKKTRNIYFDKQKHSGGSPGWFSF